MKKEKQYHCFYCNTWFKKEEYNLDKDMCFECARKQSEKDFYDDLNYRLSQEGK